MSSTKVDVKVTNDGATVEMLKARPVRLTPDGDAGVVYAAQVFPLYDGNIVRLEDGRFEKAACYRFVEPGTPIPYAQRATASTAGILIDKWNVIKNKYGVYFVFDADEETAQAVVDLIDEIGLGVKRWDVSVRPSEDGEWYDWFVRLDFSGSKEAAHRQIGTALAARAGAAGPSRHLSTDQDEVEELRQRAADLDTELARLQLLVDGFSTTAESWKILSEDARAEATAAREELDRTRQSERALQRKLTTETRKRKEAETEVSVLRSVRDQLEARAASPNDEAFNALQDMANQLIIKADEDRDAAIEMATAVQADADELRDVLRQRDEELDAQTRAYQLLASEHSELQARLSETANAETEAAKLRHAVSPRPSSRKRLSVDAFLARALPRLVLREDGLERLLEWKDPSRILFALAKLNAGVSIPAFPHQVTKGSTTPVYEVDGHFNTGKDGKVSDMGRIYFHRDGEQMLVLVHQKEKDIEQERTVKAFSKWCGTYLRDHA